MAQIIRLGKARKARAQAEAKAQADANAVRHGRTRAERARDAAITAQRDAVLDGARRDPPGAGEPDPDAPAGDDDGPG